MAETRMGTMIEEKMSGPIVAIDFDGTIATHAFPAVGEAIPGAFECMADLQAAGVRLILLTMRSDSNVDDGQYLTEAVEFCRERGIEFWAVNNNPDQDNWTTSRKVYANQYVDDLSTGTPLIHDGSGRPYVNWVLVRPMLFEYLGLS